jgi:cell division protein FtsB
MLRRARLTFLAAVVVGALVLVSELPLSDLVHARAAVASTTAELNRLRAANHSLSNQISGLKQGTTIQRIAHEDYGLVSPGQKAVIVMPGGANGASVQGDGASGASLPLGSQTIPKSDLVPTDSPLSPQSGGSSTASGQGFWQRFANRIEFWKASS